MQMTTEGLDLIKRYEGFRDHWYKCPANVWTCCYGHTEAAGAPKYDATRKFSRDEGHRILLADLNRYEEAVKRSVKVELTDTQFSALVSFCYNVGPANFAKSSVLKAVNDHRFDLVPARLALWNKGGGKVLKGLVARRSAEAALFASDVADESPHFSTAITPAKGKPVLASTTNLAATATAVAAGTSVVREITLNVADTVQVFGFDLKYLLIGLSVFGIAAALWIIKERIGKSNEEGV